MSCDRFLVRRTILLFTISSSRSFIKGIAISIDLGNSTRWASIVRHDEATELLEVQQILKVCFFLGLFQNVRVSKN